MGRECRMNRRDEKFVKTMLVGIFEGKSPLGKPSVDGKDC
jgi:hypothetical protein